MLLFISSGLLLALFLAFLLGSALIEQARAKPLKESMKHENQ